MVTVFAMPGRLTPFAGDSSSGIELNPKTNSQDTGRS